MNYEIMVGFKGLCSFCLKNDSDRFYKITEVACLYLSCANCFERRYKIGGIVCAKKNEIEPLLGLKCWIFIRYEQNDYCLTDPGLQKKLDIIKEFLMKNYNYRNECKIFSEEFLEYCYTHLGETIPAELLLKFLKI